MVMLALALAVVVTYIVWIRKPEQRLMIRLSSELKLSAAFAKPGETVEVLVTVTNDKSVSVPLLRVDIDLPEEMQFVGGEHDLPRHRSHLCTIKPHETLTFTHTAMAVREGKVTVESPELIVYSLLGAVVDNNTEERGKTVARLRIRQLEDGEED